MSTTAADYEELLRKAINEAKAAAPRAVEDLFIEASKASEAVARVTDGAAALELILANEVADAPPSPFELRVPNEAQSASTYQLQLRKVGSEAPASDLGIYRHSVSGYPVLRWSSRRKWELKEDEPDEQYQNVAELEAHFKWMISNPESRLVILVTFFKP